MHRNEFSAFHVGLLFSFSFLFQTVVFPILPRTDPAIQVSENTQTYQTRHTTCYLLILIQFKFNCMLSHLLNIYKTKLILSASKQIFVLSVA